MKVRLSKHFVIFLISFLLLIFASCGQSGLSPEEARIKLGQLNVEYSEESFFDRLAEGDVLAVKLFLIAGMDPNYEIRRKIDKTEIALTPLMVGTKAGRPEILKILLDRGAEPDFKDTKFGRTALHLAAVEGHLDAVRLLVDRGANIYARTFIGATPLMYAALGGHNEIVKFLISKGADVNTQNNKGGTALNLAAVKGHSDTVKLLLNKGANINAKCGKKGWTALFFAAVTGQTETVKVLLEKGANPNVRSKKGRTAIDYARAKGHKAIVKILQNPKVAATIATTQKSDKPAPITLEDAIVCKWQQTNRIDPGKFFIEFFNDGTLSVFYGDPLLKLVGKERGVGNYEFIDRNHIMIEYSMPGLKTFRHIYEISISGDTLTLKPQQNNDVALFKRVK